MARAHAFIITQEQTYFIENKKRTLTLPEEEMRTLGNRYEEGVPIFLYHHERKRAYGCYTIDISLARKSADGNVSVPFTGERSMRRGCFYHDAAQNKDFSVRAIGKDAAARLNTKLRIAQESPAPVLLSLRYRNATLTYRYVELLHRVLLLEGSVRVKESMLETLREEHERFLKTPAGETRYEKEIQALGKMLSSNVFTDNEVREVLCETEKIVYLDVDRKASYFPWEILADTEGFLAKRVLFSHGGKYAVRTRTRKQEGAPAVAVVYIPDESLPHGENEADMLADLIAGHTNAHLSVIKREIRALDMHRVFEEHDIVHLITHGVGKKRGNGFRLGASEVIMGEDVRGFTTPPAFVFAHTCETAFAPLRDTRYIVSALLEAGVANVIAAKGRVNDVPDMAFLGEFYESLLAGETVAVSYRNALTVASANAFLRYRFFGTHTTRFFAKESARRPG